MKHSTGRRLADWPGHRLIYNLLSILVIFSYKMDDSASYSEEPITAVGLSSQE